MSASPVAPARVDLDLDELLPEGKTFRLHGRDYRLPSEIPISTIVQALRLSERIGGGGQAEAETLEELEKLVLGVLREADPGQVDPAPRLGERSLMMVFGLLTGGEPGVELPDATRALLEGDGARFDGEEATELPPTPPNRAERRAKAASGGRRDG